MMNSAGSSKPYFIYWLPSLTAFLGYAVAALSEWWRDQRAYKREREAQGERRQEQSHMRRNEFQRATLLELQDELVKLIRAIGEGHHQDVMAHRAGGAWQKQLYGNDLDSRIHAGMTKTSTLGVRVRDKDVRRLLSELRQQCSEAVHCKNEEISERAISLAQAVYDKLNDRIGELLRILDDDEAVQWSK